MAEWLRSTPIWLLGLLLLAAGVGSAYAGSALSRWLARVRSEGAELSDSQAGYVVSSVFALLALFVAFTFSLAMDRYQTRRNLVVEEAKVIEVLYLKAQMLDEPHRSRFADLLARYTGNQLALAQLRHENVDARRLLAADEALLRDIWAATVPAYRSVESLDYSTSFVESAADLVRVDAERKAVRRSQIPVTILVALIASTLVAAAVLGGVMKTRKGRQFGVALIALNVLVIALITDINRPVEGTIRESQEPIERVLARMKANPPAVYQRLARRPGSAPPI